MGRDELATALNSAAAQDHPAIEIVVVDATGGAHPPLPEVALRPGHSLRMVGTGQRLIRPVAANVGLAAARGEFLAILDDDDTYEPHHVATLLAAASEHPECLVVYGQTSVLDPAAGESPIFGQPFNRALMHYGPLFHPQAALYRRKVLDLGCWFDPEFLICSDRDWIAQISMHSDFHYVPRIVFNYRSDLGTSGTGRGGNRDLARFIAFECRLRAKWAGPHVEHAERAARGNRQAIAAFQRGDLADAARRFDGVLSAYPCDPNALHGKARIALVEGDLAAGLAAVGRALAMNPTSAEYRLTRAELLARDGQPAQAMSEALAAAADPSFRAAAQALATKIAAQLPARDDGAISRNAPCPCGSGRRFKHCHGAVGALPGAADVQAPEADPAIRMAIADYERGEAQLAVDHLHTVDPAKVADAREARMAGDFCDEMGDDDRALAFLGRAIHLAPDPATHLRMERIWQRKLRSLSDPSLAAAARQLLPSPHVRGGRTRNSTAGTAHPIVHLVAAPADLRDAEVRAMRLFDQLHPHADVRIWSAVGTGLEGYGRCYPVEQLQADSGRHPTEGTVVFCGNDFDWGEWPFAAGLDRIVICHDLDRPDVLVTRLVALADCRDAVPVDIVFPSRLMRERSGLEGAVQYTATDLEYFSPPPGRDARQRLTIGRHGRNHPLQHHPNDASLYRRITAAGHRVRIMGGPHFASALQGDLLRSSVEILAENAMDARLFLAGLDCMIYRIHPHHVEADGVAILEAMAMELPVIAFRAPIGAVEIISHGVNGFVVDSEAQAMATIDMLAADPILRRTIGQAARDTLAATLRAQRSALLSFYLPGIDEALDQPHVGI